MDVDERLDGQGQDIDDLHADRARQFALLGKIVGLIAAGLPADARQRLVEELEAIAQSPMFTDGQAEAEIVLDWIGNPLGWEPIDQRTAAVCGPPRGIPSRGGRIPPIQQQGVGARRSTIS